jgi:dCTP deaminase
MILTDHEISQLIEGKEIAISPFSQENLKDGSYTLTLGKRVLLPVKQEILDAREKAQFVEKEIGEGIILNPGDFIVCFTEEKITLNGNVGCFLSTRSSLAQMGLNVTQGSMYAESDTDNVFALEISNHGVSPVRLTHGLRIVKAVFMRVASETKKF